MKKTYVIDTHVLIQSPYAIECFEDNDLVIPLVVVEELDGLKKPREKKEQMQDRQSDFWRATELRAICFPACP